MTKIGQLSLMTVQVKYHAGKKKEYSKVKVPSSVWYDREHQESVMCLSHDNFNLTLGRRKWNHIS